ncbi:MAG: undecaprenyl-diphosphate phosphatase [Chloroflexi bacterium]|nr:undecaprenyl-diphosphate phosphatase [Chloroflexota bacterium]
MDTLVQAVVMGLVQGLTEFLPVSSSGHLILVPALLGWNDAFIDSLAFSIMLHTATLLALLIFFRADWFRLIPAWFASIRDRSLGGDPDRSLAWLLVISTIPAVIAGLAIGDLADNPDFRAVGRVAIALVIGAGALWFGERVGSRSRSISDLGVRGAFGIGLAQALALVPGISRSGISIAAGLVAGLDRASAARYSFLMATPITAGAGIFEIRKLVAGEAGITVDVSVLVAGMLAALVAGIGAISLTLRFLRSNSTLVFIAYRLALAGLIVVTWLGLWDRSA